MINSCSNTVRLLRKEEEQLCRRLQQVRKALSVLGEESNFKGFSRPLCRADLLKNYLIHHPDGVRVKEVPGILKDMGFPSTASVPAINWLYQQGPAKHYFRVEKGVVTLRPDYTKAFPEEPEPTSTEHDASNPASTTGVNSTPIQHNENDLRG